MQYFLIGDPKQGCHQISDHSQHLRVEDPCYPSPCGKFAECVQVSRMVEIWITLSEA